MKYTPLLIPDVVLIEPKIYGDERGYFMETWRENDFKENVADMNFVQDNQSKSKRGILRGLHYQVKHSQGKLVRVISGEIYDVAVDIRKSSKTYGQYIGLNLTAKDKNMLWIPPGFAHGFYVISETAEFVYKCTEYYYPEYEKTILWNDPSLKIDWPIENNKVPILSEKDQKGLLLNDLEVFE